MHCMYAQPMKLTNFVTNYNTKNFTKKHKEKKNTQRNLPDPFPVWTIQHDSFAISSDTDLFPSEESHAFQFPFVPTEIITKL